MSRRLYVFERCLNFIEVLPRRNFANGPSKPEAKASSQYCLDLVRVHYFWLMFDTIHPHHASHTNCLVYKRQWDYEGFVSSLLVPGAAQRTTAVALRAFNVEVALVAQRVSSPAIGQARLLFWREALDQIGKGKAPRHPVAQEIFRAIQRHKLQRKFLQRLVTSRETQLSSPGFATLADLEKYAEDSMSPILYLLLQSAGCADVKVDHAASHLGKALGLSNALRGLARARSPAELGLPRDLALRHGISQESLLRGAGSTPGVRDAVFDVAACAKQHLDKSRALSGDVPRPLRAFLLPSLPVARYLERLRLVDFDPFDQRLQKRSPGLPLAMWWGRFRGKY